MISLEEKFHNMKREYRLLQKEFKRFKEETLKLIETYDGWRGDEWTDAMPASREWHKHRTSFLSNLEGSEIYKTDKRMKKYANRKKHNRGNKCTK
jgi:hypothetical protein